MKLRRKKKNKSTTNYEQKKKKKSGEGCFILTIIKDNKYKSG